MRRFKYLHVRIPPAVIRGCSKSLGYYRERGLSVVKQAPDEFLLEFTVIRNLSAVQILEDGSIVRNDVPTMERYIARLRMFGKSGLLVLENAPRGTRVQDEILRVFCRDEEYFFESLQITSEMIAAHIANFEFSILVSAKVRDLRLTDSVVCRIEVISKEGVGQELSRLVDGRFYRLDSMTYEVTHRFQKGLITYSSGGVLRVSDSLSQVVQESFEKAFF